MTSQFRFFSITLYLILVFSKPTSAQKFDWYGYYDVEGGASVVIQDMVLDHNGNIYTCGTYSITDFDIGPGVVLREADYGLDYFITKYDSLGNWIWTTTRGHNFILGDGITGLEIDDQNNIYAIGYDDDGFHNDSRFILKLNASGQILWRRDFNRDFGNYQHAQLGFLDVEMDHHGDLVIVGYIYDTTDMDPGPGVELFYPTGKYDLLLLKINAAGEMVWVKSMGSNGDSPGSEFAGFHVAIDTSNEIWVSGYYSRKVDFDPGPGEFYLESPSKKNPFIAKYDTNGNLQWAKQTTTFAANYDDYGGPLLITQTGEIYWTFPHHTGAYDPELLNVTFDYPSSRPSPILKMNGDGSIDRVIMAGTSIGLKDYHIYPNGDIMVISSVYNTADIDHSFEGVSEQTSSSTQSFTPYMIKYDHEGNFLWTRRLLDRTNTTLSYMAADDRGNVYLSSPFSSYIDLTGEEENPIPKYDLSGSQTTSSYLMKYKNLDCIGLEVEYISPDDYDDNGMEPNVSNVPFWKSPSIYNTRRPGFHIKTNFDYNESFYDNYVHITVRSEGCNTISNSKVALYFSIGDAGLSAPGPWETQYSNIGGQTVQISGKVGELEIPPLYKNDTWLAAFHFAIPVDPALFPEKVYTMNIFGRIESAFDPDANLPSQNILEQVANNNNISWRAFQVRP